MPTKATRTAQARNIREASRVVQEVNNRLRNSPASLEWFEDNRDWLISLVFSGFDASRNAAIDYLVEFARDNGESVTPLPAIFVEEQVWNSIKFTGPDYLASLLAKGVPYSIAHEKMLKKLDGAIQRHVMNGNRNTVHKTVNGDGQILGYRRVSKTGTPCFFCAMTISRGAVYKSRSTATTSSGSRLSSRRTGAGYHDNDECMAEPVYKRGEQTPQEIALQKLWNDTVHPKDGPSLYGQAAINAFRRAYLAELK